MRAHRQTGSGGLHWDVRHPGRYVPTLNGKAKEDLGRRWPGLDIKGDGGYAVALGRNKNGRYEWRRAIDADPPELVPTELWEFLQQCAKPSTELLVKMALDRIPHGGRNSAGLWLACQLRDNGYSKSDAWPVVLEYRSRCPETNAKGDPEKYTENEARASLDETYSRPPRDPWSADRPTSEAPAAEEPGAEQPASEQPPQHSKKRASPFVVTPHAVLHVDEDGAKIFVCSHLRIDARTRDVHGSEWGRLLVWTDSEGRENHWAMPMELLAGDGAELRKELLRGGLIPGWHSKANQYLLQYILSEQPEKFALCVPRLGWNNSVYVLPDISIPENNKERIIYQSPAQIPHFYQTAGTLKDWRDRVGSLCQGNSKLIFGVSMGFAGPLLEPLGVEGGGFQITDPSSVGKTTMRVVTGSVLGGGNGDKGFCRSWRHTTNALESVALIHNDSLLILDEIREMTDAKDIETAIYMLANGSNKGRMARTAYSNRPLLHVARFIPLFRGVSGFGVRRDRRSQN